MAHNSGSKRAKHNNDGDGDSDQDDNELFDDSEQEPVEDVLEQDKIKNQESDLKEEEKKE